MPNHVISRLHFSGKQEQIDELLKAIKGEDEIIDFNKLIPMPEELNITSGTDTSRGLEAYQDFIEVYKLGRDLSNDDLLNIPENSEKQYLIYRKDFRKDIEPEEWSLGKKAFQNQLKFGAPTWYEWRWSNWGTKWNAYNSCVLEDNTIEFQTAWARPMPVIEKLAEMYPEISFDYRWADEDLGSNTGHAELCDGEIFEDEFYDALSKEAYENAADLWGINLEAEGFVFNKRTNTYEYQHEYEPVESEGLKLN